MTSAVTTNVEREAKGATTPPTADHTSRTPIGSHPAKKAVLWNLEWATPRSPRGRRTRAILAELDPDVVCLTEATAAMLPDDGITRQHLAAPEPLVVLGDLNQRLPRHRQPPDVYALLQRVMAQGLGCPTADDAGWVRGHIDHMLVGAGVDALDVMTLPRVAEDGLRLSDHDGLVVRMSIAP